MNHHSDQKAAVHVHHAGSAALPVIRLAGVPEHFSAPILLAIERGMFRAAGIDVQWHEVKQGTGLMLQHLKSHSVDCIVALTEGLMTDIVRDSKSDVKLIGTYVESKLRWAISVGHDSPIKSIDQLQHTRFGISRYGSGSQLMAHVLAEQRGWTHSRADHTNHSHTNQSHTDESHIDESHSDKKAIAFAVQGTFAHLRAGVNRCHDMSSVMMNASDSDCSSGQLLSEDAQLALPTSAFMWEYYTSLPYYNSHELRHLDDLYTQWPCFMIASTQSYIQEHQHHLHTFMTVLHQSCRLFKSDANSSIDHIANTYDLTHSEAAEWFKDVRITADSTVADDTIQSVLKSLQSANIISQKQADAHPLDHYRHVLQVKQYHDVNGTK